MRLLRKVSPKHTYVLKLIRDLRSSCQTAKQAIYIRQWQQDSPWDTLWLNSMTAKLILPGAAGKREGEEKHFAWISVERWRTEQMADGWSCSQSQGCKTSFSEVFCCDLAHCNTLKNTEPRRAKIIVGMTLVLIIYIFPNHAVISSTSEHHIETDTETLAPLASTKIEGAHITCKTHGHVTQEPAETWQGRKTNVIDCT